MGNYIKTVCIYNLHHIMHCTLHTLDNCSLSALNSKSRFFMLFLNWLSMLSVLVTWPGGSPGEVSALPLIFLILVVHNMQVSIACILGLGSRLKALCIYGETVAPSDLLLLVELEDIRTGWKLMFFGISHFMLCPRYIHYTNTSLLLKRQSISKVHMQNCCY